MSAPRGVDLRGAATAALALTDVAGFTAATTREAAYRIGRWHHMLGRHLDSFLAACIAGQEPRLILEAPPRHGKTEHVGRGATAAFLARRPGGRVIYATHSQPLADKTSMAARRTVVDHLAPHLTRLRPSAEKWTAAWWETADGSGCRAVGAGVGTSGEGAHMAVVDDPFGSRADAYSRAYRDAVWGWFLSDIESRMMSGGGIVVMHTRWHQDDLVGRLMREQPGQWQRLSWPAIAEDDEPGLRRAGQALVPHMFDLARLERIKGRLVTEQGSAAWAALYQQRPVTQGGNMFRRDWFGTRYASDPRIIAATCDEVVLTSDAAAKGGGGSDLCAIQVWGRKGAAWYLLARWAARADYPTYERRMDGMIAEWGGALTLVLVEEAGHGAAYVQRRRGQVLGLVGFIPTRDTPGHDKGKEARAVYGVGPAEAGNIHLPEAVMMPGVEEFLDCLCAFPAGVHDDEVDAASQLWVRWSRQAAFNPDEWANVSLAV